MQPQFTLRDIFKFVYRHRRGTAMVDWPMWKVYALLECHFKRGQLHITANNSAISGMVIAVPELEHIRIEQIICASTDAFKVLRAACRHRYPGKDLVYFRHKTQKAGRWPARKV